MTNKRMKEALLYRKTNISNVHNVHVILCPRPKRGEMEPNTMKNNKGFTILEMMIVLSIIALVFLLTLPNIQQKEKIIRSKGCEALIEVANAQILLYEVENLSPPKSMSDLIGKGYLKDTQRRCPNGDTIEISNGQASVR